MTFKVGTVSLVVQGDGIGRRGLIDRRTGNLHESSFTKVYIFFLLYLVRNRCVVWISSYTSPNLFVCFNREFSIKGDIPGLFGESEIKLDYFTYPSFIFQNSLFPIHRSRVTFITKVKTLLVYFTRVRLPFKDQFLFLSKYSVIPTK